MKIRTAILVLSVLALKCTFAAEVDVTTLGAKNDGSADVSEIVNAATEKNALFFPAGKYRVEHPLVLKNPIRGAGFARAYTNGTDSVRTWLVSALSATNDETAVVTFGGKVQVNVEEINIVCNGPESAISVAPCTQMTMTFISKVGVFNLAGTGIRVWGRGSRPVFVQDFVAWGRPYAPKSCGIDIGGCVVDNRLTNIEVMGTRIGLHLGGSHAYGDNIHIWTGSMSGKDDGTWWLGTRGIVLEPTVFFTASQVYPDTCFYAIEQRGSGQCEISNLMYCEDWSVNNPPNRVGEFYHKDPAESASRLIVNGGYIALRGDDANPGRMGKIYAEDSAIHDVTIECRYALVATNIDLLCFGTALPDYEVRYADRGWCKFADIFTCAPTGFCEGELSLESGAAWSVSLLKEDGHLVFASKPLNQLAKGELRMIESDGMAQLYYQSETAEPTRARFRTLRMSQRFRPVDHGILRDAKRCVRYREVLHFGPEVSEDYRMTVEGAAVEVYRVPTPEPSGGGIEDKSEWHPYSYAPFVATGAVEVCVKSGVFDLSKTEILPKSKGIVAITQSADTVRFRMTPPMTLVLEPKGRHRALVVSANVPEKVGVESRGRVKAFGPGFHRAGEIELGDGETLYLAPGAWVEGWIRAKGRDITVCGSGVLSGACWKWGEGPRDATDKKLAEYLALISGENITVKDVTFFSSWGWTLVFNSVTNALVDNVKVIGGRVINDDGIDICRAKDVVIRNSFVRCQDDCITPKWWCENFVCTNLTLWTDAANVFRTGYECESGSSGLVYRNHLIKDIDILHLALNRRPATNYWANSAICLQPSHGQRMSDLVYEDLRFHECGPGDLFLNVKTMPITQGLDFKEAGMLSNLVLRNIHLPDSHGGMSVNLSAHDDAHPIEGVRFDDVTGYGPVTITGKVLLDTGSGERHLRGRSPGI